MPSLLPALAILASSSAAPTMPAPAGPQVLWTWPPEAALMPPVPPSEGVLDPAQVDATILEQGGDPLVTQGWTDAPVGRVRVEVE